MARNAYRLRRGQSPISSGPEIMSAYFNKAQNGQKTFRWNRPVNMSMDQKTINRLMDARKCMEIPLKKEASAKQESIMKVRSNQSMEKLSTQTPHKTQLTQSRKALLEQI